MAHHGYDNFDLPEGFDMKKAFTEHPILKRPGLAHHLNELNAGGKVGATGNFPEGKLDETDEGEIGFGIATYNNEIIISFGEKPISWIGLTKEQALGLAEYLHNKAKDLK